MLILVKVLIFRDIIAPQEGNENQSKTVNIIKEGELEFIKRITEGTSQAKYQLLKKLIHLPAAKNGGDLIIAATEIGYVDKKGCALSLNRLVYYLLLLITLD